MPIVSSFRGTTGPISSSRKYATNNYFGNGSDGAVTFASSTNFTASTDGDMVVRNYTTMTINSGVTVTTNTRCKGLLIFVQGNCTINGTLSMTARGPNTNATSAGVPATGLKFPFVTPTNMFGNTEVPVNSSFSSFINGAGTAAQNQLALLTPFIQTLPVGSLPTLVRQGAPGGPAQGRGGGNGFAGTSGGVGQTGGGGGGTARAGGAGAPSGAGSFGSCFGGGSGGGSNAHGDGPAGGAGAWGAGGGGGSGWSGGGGHFAPGGSGNPGGGGSNGGATGNSGTGGLIILIVGGLLTVTGAITADGVNGVQNGGNDAGGGGATGGGNLLIAYKSLSNTGTIAARGGSGALGSGAGGAGSVQLIQLV
jgi:hypothetical protein